jgi:Domain of unknown function DUF29
MPTAGRCTSERGLEGGAESLKTGLYEEDFVLWAEEQAIELRRAADSGSNLRLEWINLAEIDSLGRSQRLELKSRVANLTEHLLKLDLSSAVEPRAVWIETVERERREIDLLLEDSPSLRGEVAAIASAVWPRTSRSVRQVLAERGEMRSNAHVGAEKSVYTVERLLGPWLPDRASSAHASEGASRGSP